MKNLLQTSLLFWLVLPAFAQVEILNNRISIYQNTSSSALSVQSTTSSLLVNLQNTGGAALRVNAGGGFPLRGSGVEINSTNSIALDVYSSGNKALKTNGALQFMNNNEGDGKVLTSDASGNATWQDKLPKAFNHISSALNITSNSSKIDHPATNGNPNAIITFQHIFDAAPSNVLVNKALGLYYATGYWYIYIEDQSAFPVNAKFNVIVMNP